MLYLVDSLFSSMSYSFQTNPNQHGTTNMISHNPRFTALTSFYASKLLSFSVNLLNLPTKAARLLYSFSVILSYVICYNIVRALVRKHNPEQLHFVLFRKTLDLNQLAMFLFIFAPFLSESTRQYGAVAPESSP